MAVTRDELLKMISEKLGQSTGGGQQRTQPAEKSGEEQAKYKEKAEKEYQRVQSVKKLSGTYNPGERERAQMAQRDALVAADNEAIGHRKNAALAQKEYDDYKNSQEFQQRKREAATQLTRNTPMSEVPRNAPQMTEVFEDETAKELKAKADYYKKLSNDEKTRRIMAQDMAEINAMPEEDRKLFERYAGDNTEQISTLTPLDLARAMEETETELIKKYGAERLAELKESYSRYTAEQEAERVAQSTHDMNDTVVGAVGQNIIGLPARALGGLSALGGRAFELIDRTGRYPTLAPYTAGDIMSVYGNAVTADTAERIAGDGDSKLRKGLSVGYQAVTSAADSAARMALAAATGGASGSLALAGINSFTDTLREASQKGATPGQAYLMATASAGLEVLTEKVSLDKALDKAKQLGGSDLRKWVLNTIGQGAVEISEEEASYIGGLIAEAAILQGKSEYNQTIGELVANGMSYEEAKAQANKDVWNEAVNTAAVSGLSGSIMGAGATAYSDVMTKLGKQGTQASPQEAAENPQVGILPETSMDTAKAQSPDAEAAGAPQTGNALTNALDKLAETGNVSNKTVEKILSDPAAMEQLSRQTGLDLSQMATASEKRNAVKAAVRQMAGDAAPTTLNREGAQSLIEDMGQELAERAPARQETPEVSPKRQAVQNAIDQVLGVDTGTDGNYNAINGNPTQGGTENGTGLQENDGTGSTGNPEQGLAGVQQNNGKEAEGRREHGGVAVDSGELRVSDKLQEAQMEKGSPQVADSSGQSTEGGQVDATAKKSVGAADRDFTGTAAYDDLLSDDNVQPRRASDAKNVEVPKVDAYGREVSENAHNLINSDIISDRDIDTAKRLIQEGAFGHETQHMDDVRDAVYAEIQKKGLARSVGEVSGAATKGKLSEYDVAKAQVLLAMVTDKKGERAADYASDLMVTLSQMATQSGRQLSMFRLFRKMTPEGQLMTVQKSVKNNVEKMIRSGQVKKGFEATIDPELEQDYLNAAKEAGRAKDPQSQKEAQQKMKDVENAIYATVAAQMPATEKAKWDAWRYMCMLGNVKTQARNLAGNAMFMPFKAVKDKMGALMELAIPQEQRTKSLLTDRELLQWAKQDAKSDMVQDALKYSGKLGDDVTSQKLFDNRKIYDNKALETVRKWTKAAPEVGDMIFKNPYYSKSLAGFLTARGYSVGDITSGKVSDTILDEGRAYAIDEAMKATFNDCNGFSDLFATTLRYKGDSPYGKAANLLGEGIMPFRRTPANIVVRFTEYSPVGLVKGLVNTGRSIASGKVTASTAIDQLSAGLTGTAAMALGGLLASGIGGIRLTGSDVDDDEKRRGRQTYALEFSIGGKDYSYRIDWAAPANLPLFVGANIYNLIHNQGEDVSVSKFTAFLRGMGTMLEPMLSLSCLSSLNDVIQSGRYAEDGGIVLAVLSNMATSYFTQGIPTLARQASQLFQENKQITFANSADPTIRDIQKEAANIPFLGNRYKTDKVNAWGEKEKNGIGEGAANWMTRAFDAFANPGTLKKIDNGALETEIERLNGAQEENVSPPEAGKTVSYTDKNGEVHKNQRLTEEEYQTLATTQGKTADRIVSQMIASEEYAAMTDRQKAQAVKLAYEYAKAKGLSETFPDYAGLDGWKRGIDGKETEAIFRKIVTSEFSKAFDAMEPGALDQAYGLYKSLPATDQADFRKETGGRVGYYITAKEAGVSDKAFTGLYGTYKELGDNSGMTNNQKAQEWSRTLAEAYEDGRITKAGHDALKDAMKFRQTYSIDTEKFDSMTESGLTSDVADRIIKGLADLQGTGSVNKDTGKAAVTNRDKWGYIAALDGLSDKEKDRVMLLYMPDYNPEAEKPNKTELKYAYLRSKGYSAEQFTQTYGVTQVFTKKADMIAAWVALGYSNEEAQMFYKLYKGKLV